MWRDEIYQILDERQADTPVHDAYVAGAVVSERYGYGTSADWLGLVHRPSISTIRRWAKRWCEERGELR
jgi:hypothetical protein